MTLRSPLWAELTRDEIAAAAEARALVVIPVGSTEQHGEHLPTGTDSFGAGTMSLAAARACGHPVLVAPLIAWGHSPHHLSWPGTISLRLATMAALLEDVTRCIEGAGFRRQLLVNGHGGNRGPLAAIAAEFVCAGREVGYVDYFAPPKAELDALMKGAARGATHAGEFETALVMAMDRDHPAKLAFYQGRARGLPLRTKATAQGTTRASPISAAGAWWPSMYLGDDPGYTGDPAAATVETGARMAEAIVGRLAAFFAAFAVAALPSGVKPPAGP